MIARPRAASIFSVPCSAAALALALALALAFGLGGLVACSAPREAYPCASSAQCQSGGEQGTCAGGFCAFADPSCPGGLRYEPAAGDGLGGTCAPAPPSPPGACGAAGQACCAPAASGASDEPCGDHLTCTGGTCASCVVDLALGRRFSCVVSRGGTIWCAGENVKGQLGLGIAGVPSATRVQVRDATSVAITDAIAVGAGREHACAIRAGGAVWCWGANERGQLGNNVALSPAPPPRPAAVAVVRSNGLPLTNIVEVGGGGSFTCARDADGGVWCWGDNSGGLLGDGTTTGRSVAAPVLDAPMGAPLTGALALHVGRSVACVRKADDATWCWGQNGNGQFGDGTQASHPSPVLLGTTRSVGLGTYHSCRVEPDATVSCAGWNGHARLGIGTGGGFQGAVLPTWQKVLASRGGPPFTGAVEVVSGGVTCARMQSGGVQCWGDSGYGQTGTGQGETVPAPVRTADGTPLSGVTRLFAGYTHVCALLTSGDLSCWGRNNDGELGAGTFGNRGFPGPIEDTCR